MSCNASRGSNDRCSRDSHFFLLFFSPWHLGGKVINEIESLLGVIEKKKAFREKKRGKKSVSYRPLEKNNLMICHFYARLSKNVMGPQDKKKLFLTHSFLSNGRFCFSSAINFVCSRSHKARDEAFL